MRTLIGILLLVAVVAYAGFVAHTNSTPVRINLLFTAVEEIPLWLALLGAFVLGALLTGIACSWPMLRLRLSVRRQNQSITRLEQEIHGLRTLPLEEDVHAGDASAREG